MCLLFVFATCSFAQETVKKTKAETEKGAKEAKEAKEKADKKAKATKAKVKKYVEKVNNDLMAKKKAATKIPLKKDGTLYKHYKVSAKENSASAMGEKKSAEEKEDLKETPTSKVAKKKVKDKVTGKYNGKKSIY
jgi:hypothetical protein